MKSHLLVAGALCAAASFVTAAPAASAMAASDSAFVTKAAMSGTEEVREGKAEQHSSDANAGQFAVRMIGDHSKNNTQLAALAQKLGMTAQVNQGIAQAPQPSEQPGPAYLTKEVADHKKTIALFEQEANNGRNPSLRMFARESLPVLRSHLQMAERLSGST